ncbi:MAG: DUF5666 domain-containing protein [Thermoanaerobaculia bacterium]
MRKTLLFLAVTLILLPVLAGCNGENSLTGPAMGERSLSGQVVPVGDLAGASPAGISVTAPGQVAVTDGAGRFAFLGLANENVQLAFSREDGISASGMVSASAGTVVVELQKKQATIKETGQAKRELEGLITAISSDSISITDASSGPQTVAITPSTVIRKGNTALTTDNLKVGDRVHIKASVGADGSLTAFEIMLQNSGDTTGGGGQIKELEGLITAISTDSITVMNASTNKPETAAITKSTVIRTGNKTLTTDDLHVGDRVHVKTTSNGDGTLTAKEIMLQNPA